MRVRRVLAAAAVAAVALVGLCGPASADTTPSATVGDVTTEGDTLHLTVSASGLPEGAGLDPGSLTVTVDGQPVSASVDSSATTGTTHARRIAVIVVDNSGSMAGAPLAGAKQAAQRFVDQVPSDVLVGVVAFADSARVVVAPTGDRSRVSHAIATMRAAGNTTLYDALVLGAGQLGTSGTRLLVVLSDGADTSSRATLGSATAVVRASGATTRLVAYRTDAAQTATLRNLAAQVGGAVVPAADPNQLLTAFSSAAGVFGSQVDVSATLPDHLADGQHDVTVGLRFGSTALTGTAQFATTPPLVVPSSTPQAPTTGLSVPPARTLLPLLALVFVSILCLVLAVLTPRRQSESVRSLHGLDVYAVPGAAEAASGQEPQQGPGSFAQAALGITDRFVQNRGLQERLAVRLDRAEMRMRPEEWVLACCGIGVGAVLVLTLLFGNTLIGIPAGVALTWFGTHLYVSHRGSKRLKAFEEELPNTLQLVASSLQTGFSLPQAVDAAASNGQQPMAGELGRALAEARLGAPLEDGLDRVAYRMDSRDLQWTVMAVRIQRQVGGNLAEVLQTTAKTMRDRAAMRRQVRALSAEGRLSAYILIALPLGLTAFLFLTRRSYLSLLWTTKLGLILSGIAVLGLGIGWFWMRKLVDVEV